MQTRRCECNTKKHIYVLIQNLNKTKRKMHLVVVGACQRHQNSRMTKSRLNAQHVHRDL